MLSDQRREEMGMVRPRPRLAGDSGGGSDRHRASISTRLRSYCDGVRRFVLGSSYGRYSRTCIDWSMGERTEATPAMIKWTKQRIGYGLLLLAHSITIALIIGLFLLLWSHVL
jgi:hypothetical protein